MAFTDDIKTDGQFWRKNIEKLQAIYDKLTGTGSGSLPVSGTVESYIATFAKGTTNADYPTSESLSTNKTGLHVEPLGIPTTARQLAAGAASVNTALTTSCRRISIRAITADIRFVVGSTSQTANASTSHFIAVDERLDIALPPTPNIAIIRAASTSGTLEVTELA